MISWKGKTLTDFVRAGQFEPYAPDIVNNIKEYIEGKEVIDAGCGPGNISRVLTKYAKSVIGIDTQSYPIEFAEDFYSNIDNLSFKVGNFFDLESNSCDVLVCVSVGRIDENNLKLLRVPKEHLIFVNTLSSQYFPSKNHNNYDDFYLKKFNCKYEAKRISTSFGQPFKDFDEAIEFIKRHNLAEDIEKFAEKNLKKIDGEFSLYLENKKELQITIIESDNYDKRRKA